MSKIKEDYLQEYEYYDSLNRSAIKNIQKDTKSVFEKLQILYMVQKVMETEHEGSIQLSLVCIILLFGTFVYQFSISTVVLYMVGFFLAKKCVDKSEEHSRNEFLKSYPKHFDLFHKSRKEIDKSISELNNHLEQNNKLKKV